MLSVLVHLGSSLNGCSCCSVYDVQSGPEKQSEVKRKKKKYSEVKRKKKKYNEVK